MTPKGLFYTLLKFLGLSLNMYLLLRTITVQTCKYGTLFNENHYFKFEFLINIIDMYLRELFKYRNMLVSCCCHVFMLANAVAKS